MVLNYTLQFTKLLNYKLLKLLNYKNDIWIKKVAKLENYHTMQRF